MSVLEALLVYIDMLWHNIQPGNFSFSVALKACVNLKDSRLGRGVHGQVIKSSEEPDQVVNDAPLSLYAQCGCSSEVLKMFDEMPQRNVVSWNSLIGGFAKQDQLFEDLDVFRKMQSEGTGFSWVIITTILPICAQLTTLYSGKELHVQIVKSAKRPDVLVLNALIDMYVKCGMLDYGRKLFNGMSSEDLTAWNAMLTGYAINGRMKEARKLFDEMVSSGLRPDEVTFIALLSCYSHARLTEDGMKLFDKMDVDFRVSPYLEHYACLIDILGRQEELRRPWMSITCHLHPTNKPNTSQVYLLHTKQVRNEK